MDSLGLVRARIRGDATMSAALGAANVDEGTSHTLRFGGLYVSHVAIADRHQYWNPARTDADFDGDGHIDIFYSPLDGSPEPRPPELYINNGRGGFDLAAGFFGDAAGGVHPRKALPGDFNGDGRPDVLVLDHGTIHPGLAHHPTPCCRPATDT